MLTTLPPSRRRAAPYLVMKWGARTFTAKTRSYSRSSIASKGRDVPIAALFTRMSRPSACRSKASHSAWASPAGPSSTPIVNAEPPEPSIAATVSSAAASLLP
ncbi:hypothetical protein GCM10023335_40180 [Streptomyces siamensis]|uniref:Uncharacterized protein n=1 Tax=Streptomyces siamensis TaxID=1274986 RepID=A0ABP9IZ31_9ACTN